jgi:hypothetical protein
MSKSEVTWPSGNTGQVHDIKLVKQLSKTIYRCKCQPPSFTNSGWNSGELQLTCRSLKQERNSVNFGAVQPRRRFQCIALTYIQTATTELKRTWSEWPTSTLPMTPAMTGTSRTMTCTHRQPILTLTNQGSCPITHDALGRLLLTKPSSLT